MGYLEEIRNLGEKLAVTEQFNNIIIEAINTSHEGIAILDENGSYLYMNRAHEAIFGYDVDEMIGKSWEILYSEEDVQKFQEIVFPILEKEGKWTGEATAISKDGKTLIHEIVYLTALPNGGMICTCRDKNEDENRWAI